MGIFFQNLVHHADVVELVDTLDSGSSACKGMKVQVLSSALKNPIVRYRVFRFCVVPPSNCLLGLCSGAALHGSFLRHPERSEGSSDIPFY